LARQWYEMEMDHHLYYSHAFVDAVDAFDTTRKAEWIVESLALNPISGVQVCEPRLLSRVDAERVHSRDYIRALETGMPPDLANSSGIAWDGRTFSRGLSTCGGLLAAAEDALRCGVGGCLASGFHHARKERGLGFCTLNGLSIVAELIAQRTGNHVLILDLDAHCGGGTHGLITNSPRIWQVDVSVDPFDRYTPGKRGMLAHVADPRDYLRSVWACLKRAEEDWPHFCLCLYNAGMDVHQACPHGGLAGMDELLLTLREEMVFQWCGERGIPIAYAMAGGYTGRKMTREKLVHLHRMTLSAAIRRN
jgi:acetoin utilization deacetylase AcuC-like enzyme